MRMKRRKRSNHLQRLLTNASIAALLCGFLTCALAAPQASGQPDPADAWDPSKYPESVALQFREAEKAFLTKQYERALRVYLEIAEERPEIPLAHIGAASSAAKLKNDPLAAKHYRVAAEALPAHGSLAGELGDALMRMGREDEAERWYQRALETKVQTGRVSWLLSLGSIESKRNRHEQAAEWYQKALRIDPNNAAAQHNWASAMLRLNRIDEADEGYRRAIALDPRNARAFFGRAQIAQRRGSMYAARDRYLRAAEIDPSEPAYHYAAAQTMLRLGERKRAERSLQKYRRAKAEIYRAQGQAFMRRQEWKAALARLLPSIETDPTLADARRDLGFCYLQLGRLEQARAEFLAALELEPDSPPSLLYLGVCEFQSGRLEEAERRLRQAVKMRPEMTDAYQQLTRVLEAQDRTEEAAAILTEAVQHNPGWGPGYWRRGTLRLSLGMEAEAERDLREAMRLSPESPFPKISLARLLAERGRGLDEALRLAAEAHETAQSAQSAAAKAVVHFARGEAEEARRLLEEALRRDPDHPDARAAQETIESAGGR